LSTSRQKQTVMPSPVEVVYERTFSGTPRRIFQLIAEMGTSGDAIWPFASQPFIRSAGPLTPGTTEEWHLGLHAILDGVEPERRVTWRFDTDGIEGIHEFTLEQQGRRVVLRHRFAAMLSDTQGRLLWRRVEEQHERAINGLFDKLARVLKR
jgi:uncharacterized protein YndB with AHSA1/START domain